MTGSILSEWFNVSGWADLVWLIPVGGFQLWMLVHAILNREWVWAALIFFFPFFGAFWYFLTEFRGSGSLTRGFELPGAQTRKRIKELEAQIHHLDKAHHYSQLGDIYFQRGKLDKAESCYRAALERDPQDIDTRAHLGQCLLRLNRPAEARALLEAVCAENPNHDYGHSMMAYAEALNVLGETDAALKVWQQVTTNHSYPRAKVQLAELYIAKGQTEQAKAELEEVLNDDPHAPAFQRKRDRPWVRRARRLLRQLEH